MTNFIFHLVDWPKVIKCILNSFMSHILLASELFEVWRLLAEYVLKAVVLEALFEVVFIDDVFGHEIASSCSNSNHLLILLL